MKPTFGAPPVSSDEVTEKKSRKRFGSMWRKKSVRNQEYFSVQLKFDKDSLNRWLSQTSNEHGNVEVNVMAFQNDDKTKDTHPDFVIIESNR